MVRGANLNHAMNMSLLLLFLHRPSLSRYAVRRPGRHPLTANFGSSASAPIPTIARFKPGEPPSLWTAKGHKVKLVLRDQRRRWPLARGRRPAGPAPQGLRGGEQADKTLGVTCQVLDIHDGELLPTLENRRPITRLIREWKADVVIAPRPNDYHPDHRATGELVQDAAYMVTVPFFCPDVPHLTHNPVFLYYPDGFQNPIPFSRTLRSPLTR